MNWCLWLIIDISMCFLTLIHVNRIIKILHPSAIYVLNFLFLIDIYLTHLRHWLFPYFAFKWEEVVARWFLLIKLELHLLALLSISLLRGNDVALYLSYNIVRLLIR